MYKYNLLYTCWWLLLGTGRSKNLTNRVLWTISITHGLSTNVASMKVIMTAECIRLAMELWLATRKHLWTSESRIWVSTSGVGILRKPQVKISGLSVFPVSKKSFFGWRFLVKTLQKEVSTQGNAFFFTSDPSLPGLKKTSVSFTTKIADRPGATLSEAFKRIPVTRIGRAGRIWRWALHFFWSWRFWCESICTSEKNWEERSGKKRDWEMMMMYDDHTKGWLALDLAYMCHLYAYVCNLISLTLRMYTRLQYTVFFHHVIA